ncbi:hypothetical protein PPYR_07539 [Photinus pyralis]|uniref:Mitochondrial import inner membrane translocase subunit Tim16 n=1 Tax=Photinus pyralis TaxID=7054 RepID=A0A1Y1KI32_PHOPY|nr:mitochondrial import inner membrane translocase subunit Tim16 [Photinus pyralis]KAB0799659.1 hypothetical protein PPYR_07539 [Photinus pyralis]
MARFIAQIIITGTQVVARAFARAVRQEMQASQEAAQRLGNQKSRAERFDNLKLGLTLEEAKQILNVKDINSADIKTQYEFLFKQNEREKGGTFYIQSKIVRAKERLEHELTNVEAKPKTDSSKNDT